jgi:hypothetical protein
VVGDWRGGIGRPHSHVALLLAVADAAHGIDRTEGHADDGGELLQLRLL